MKKLLKPLPEEPICFVSTDIVYTHHVEFCNTRYVPLHISIIRPRSHFPYDPVRKALPVLAFLCGGAWVETDHNAWLAELSWFAKRGFVVASIEYPTASSCRYPDSLVAIKQGLRFLRANADEVGIDPAHIFLMGESAGGYLALMAAATADCEEFKSGIYPQLSDSVSAVISFYPPESPLTVFSPDLQSSGKVQRYVPPQYSLPIDAYQYPHIAESVTKKMPPTLLIHGTADDLVPIENSEKIYAALLRKGVEADFWVLEGANHSDYKCFQTVIKERILGFLQLHL